MAEALAALSLASNIIQFIDFGGKVLATGYKLYKNSFGGSDIQEIKYVTTGFQRLVEGFSNCLHEDTSAKKVSHVEADLRTLAKHCNDIAEELLAAVNKIDVQGRLGKWKSFRVALKSVLAEEKIEKIEVRLDKLRQQIILHILACFRDDLNGSMAMQTSLASLVKNIGENSELIGERFLQFIDESKAWQDGHLSECDRWRAEIIEAIHNNDRDFAGRTSLSHGKCEKRLLGKLIGRLRFEEMTDRHERIAEAYEATFKWIFSEIDEDVLDTATWSSFPQWLQTESSLYWITGKAGSGKSTLMKYIYQDPLTFEHLQVWSAKSPLVTAAFYFWNSGTNMQMSHKGLMQSLLHQILSSKPELTPQLLPERWETYCFFGNDLHHLTEKELRRAFGHLKKLDASIARFCLFIDGLDEFDGDHMKLVSLMKDLTESPNLKLCVSSRPWVVFEDAFKLEPSLMLEELTYPDIMHFIQSMFSENAGFTELHQREPEYAGQLLEDIAHKASGVFLWVHLVVHSLLDGLSNGDRISDLQRRLSFLPPDLENLYRKILNSLDPFYLEHASQLFHIIRVAHEPPSILCMSFADEDPRVILDLKVAPLTAREIKTRLEVMKRRLNSRCKGLLEVGRTSDDLFTETRRGTKPRFDASSTVQYLHKTVKDFLEDPKTWDSLMTSRKTSYDPNFALSTAYLGLLKSAVNIYGNASVFWYQVKKCLEHAMLVEVEKQADLVELLDELDSAASVLATRSGECNEEGSAFGDRSSMVQRYLNSNSSWFSKVVDSRRYSVLQPHWICTMYNSPTDFAGLSFLSIAVRLDLYEYVRAKVKQGCLVKQDTGVWPLLSDSIMSMKTEWLPDTPRQFPSRRMVKLLLDNGADPNREIPNKQLTVWQQLLWQSHNQYNLPGKAQAVGIGVDGYLEIIPLFLNSGADQGAISDRSRMNRLGRFQVGAVLQEYLQANKKSWFNWGRNESSDAEVTERDVEKLIQLLGKYRGGAERLI